MYEDCATDFVSREVVQSGRLKIGQVHSVKHIFLNSKSILREPY